MSNDELIGSNEVADNNEKKTVRKKISLKLPLMEAKKDKNGEGFVKAKKNNSKKKIFMKL